MNGLHQGQRDHRQNGQNGHHSHHPHHQHPHHPHHPQHHHHHEHHVSFLETLARDECKSFPCREHSEHHRRVRQREQVEQQELERQQHQQQHQQQQQQQHPPQEQAQEQPPREQQGEPQQQQGEQHQHHPQHPSEPHPLEQQQQPQSPQRNRRHVQAIIERVQQQMLAEQLQREQQQQREQREQQQQQEQRRQNQQDERADHLIGEPQQPPNQPRVVSMPAWLELPAHRAPPGHHARNFNFLGMDPAIHANNTNNTNQANDLPPEERMYDRRYFHLLDFADDDKDYNDDGSYNSDNGGDGGSSRSSHSDEYSSDDYDLSDVDSDGNEVPRRGDHADHENDSDNEDDDNGNDSDDHDQNDSDHEGHEDGNGGNDRNGGNIAAAPPADANPSDPLLAPGDVLMRREGMQLNTARIPGMQPANIIIRNVVASMMEEHGYDNYGNYGNYGYGNHGNYGNYGGTFGAHGARSALPNPLHTRIKNLLISLAHSEDRPLIRADIPWSLITKCEWRQDPHLSPLVSRETIDAREGGEGRKTMEGSFCAGEMAGLPFQQSIQNNSAGASGTGGATSTATLGNAANSQTGTGTSNSSHAPHDAPTAPPPPSTPLSNAQAATLLHSLYSKAQPKEISDPNGTQLLQGMLRMDPPLEAVQRILEAFPLCCLDMGGFFTACQFCHPNTSRATMGTKANSTGKTNGVDSTGKTSGDGTKGKNGAIPPMLNSNCEACNERDRILPTNNHPHSNHHHSNYNYESLDEVGEVVKLVMHQTILTRRTNHIQWGMVAFLGDARLNPNHAKLLLRHSPEALVDARHGTFGVSPLDRMASGVFIHGESGAWVEKLKLALRTASYVRWRRERETSTAKVGSLVSRASLEGEITLPPGFFSSDSQFMRRDSSMVALAPAGADEAAPPVASFDTSLSTTSPTYPTSTTNKNPCPTQSFYPYHELLRLLTSPHFRGNKFGTTGFLNTLAACTKSNPSAFLRPDNRGDLPLHVALGTECNTNLGTKAERRLIKYLLDLDRGMALVRDGRGRMPLRLCVENAWPVFDLIVRAALSGASGVSGASRAGPSRFPSLSSSSFCLGIEERAKALEHSQGKEGKEPPGNDFQDYISTHKVYHRPLLHDALDGPFHPRFGIHGARQLIKSIQRKVLHYRASALKKSAHHHAISAISTISANSANSAVAQPQPSSISSTSSSASANLLTEFLDADGRTALHVALENKWPVYDILLRVHPFSMEARDPTRHGFFPFQIAACSFASREDHKSNIGNQSKTTGENATGEKEAYNGICTNGACIHRMPHDVVKVDAEKERKEKEADLLETSMLYELIRENPLCVTWGMSGEKGKKGTKGRKGRKGEHATAAIRRFSWLSAAREEENLTHVTNASNPSSPSHFSHPHRKKKRRRSSGHQSKTNLN